MNLKVKIHGGQVAYQEVLDALIKDNFQRMGHNPDDFEKELADKIPPTPPSPPPPKDLTDHLRRKSTVDVGQAFALDLLSKYAGAVHRWKVRALARAATGQKHERSLDPSAAPAANVEQHGLLKPLSQHPQGAPSGATSML